MRIDEKPWGTNRLIYQGPYTEVWHASIKAGGVSSDGRMHKHALKNNDFYVVSGTLEVSQEDGDFLAGSTMRAGSQFSISAGRWHRFEAVTDVELIEVYHLPVIDPDDIERQAVHEYANRLEYYEPVGATFTGG